MGGNDCVKVELGKWKKDIFLEEEMRFIISGGTEILPAPLDTAEEQKNDPYVRNCQ